MGRETVEVQLDNHGDRRIEVEADVRHGNIVTGNPGSGARNITWYNITIHGIECRGYWDDDARNPIKVESPPEELRRLLMPLWREQERARLDAEYRRLSPEDRRYFGESYDRARASLSSG